MKSVAVLGLGTMGCGIAQVFASAGCEVRGYDEVEAARSSARDRARRNLQELSEAGMPLRDGTDATLQRLTVVDSEPDAVKGAEFVIEAVREDLAVKQQLFARLEKTVPPSTILATNTSTLSVAAMSEHLKHQDRVVVSHWFNPPHIIPVVEVVPGPKTSEATMLATIELLRRSGKFPVRLNRDIPGFVVNRVQAAMIREVWALLDAGLASAEDIDTAVQGSMGFRLAASGPLEINDFGGLDVWRRVYENLTPQIYSGTRLPDVIKAKVEAGEFGPKTGKGIYDYPPERLEKVRTRRDRLFLRLAKMMWSTNAEDA
jgi:3-hydroxybutyryl-CoA dehydrogenase